MLPFLEFYCIKKNENTDFIIGIKENSIILPDSYLNKNE